MPLTPEQFNKLATKKDHQKLDKKVDGLEKKFNKLSNGLNIFKFSTAEEFKKINKKFDIVDGKIDKITDTLDFLVKNTTDHNAEHAANQGAHDRMQGALDNHEIRIKKLETKAF